MKTLEEFEQFYKTELLEKLQELETIRKDIVRFNRNLVLILLGLLGVLIFIIAAEFISLHVKFIIFGIAIVLAGIYLVPAGTRVLGYNFNMRFKQVIISRMIEFISPDLTYRPTIYITYKYFQSSRIFLQKINRYKGDDYVGGKIGNTQFGFSEIIAESSAKVDDSHSLNTVFSGLFFVADFNKEFKGSTVLLPNYLGNRFRFLKKALGFNRRERLVDLEDPEFSKYYNCYSDDDIKARYILSNGLMQRIVSFVKEYPENSIYFSFVDGVMYMAINHKRPLFEVNLGTSMLNRKIIREYFLDIKLAVDAIETLNLNTRIWSKE
jgi:hypothetical protein